MKVMLILYCSCVVVWNLASLRILLTVVADTSIPSFFSSLELYHFLNGSIWPLRQQQLPQ